MSDDWRVKGTVILACNCDYGCPCNFNGRPSTGSCEGGWVWHVEQGTVDGVSLDGIAFSVFAKWPAAIHEGGGTAVSLMDERADDAQREAVTRLVRGELGPPWGIFINTYELDGPHPAPCEISYDEWRSRLRFGEIELELAPVANPVTGAEVHPRAVLPEGLVFKEGSLARSVTFRVGELGLDHSGRYAAFGPFEYSS